MSGYYNKLEGRKNTDRPTKKRRKTSSGGTTASTTEPSQTVTVGSCDNVSERFEKVGRIGQGTYGIVYKARDRYHAKNSSGSSSEYVALKRCIPHHESSDGFPLTTLREIHALRVCSQHPNIVRLLQVAVSTSSSSSSSSSSSTGGVFLVFEYCPQDLAQLIDKYYTKHRKSPFTQSQVKRLLQQLLSACDFMHSNYLIHRDIKLSNLLYTAAGDLKLADFGLSRHYSDSQCMGSVENELPTMSSSAPPLTPNVVSLWYRPPELLFGARRTIKRIPTNNNNNATTTETKSTPSSVEVTSTTTRYSTKIDLWAVGCCFSELLLGYPLLDGKDELEQISKMITCFGWPPNNLYPDAIHQNHDVVESMRDNAIAGNNNNRRGGDEKSKGNSYQHHHHHHRHHNHHGSNARKGSNEKPLLDRFHYLPADGLLLLTKLLEYNPDTRWSARQALSSMHFQQHPLPATKMPTSFDA